MVVASKRLFSAETDLNFCLVLCSRLCLNTYAAKLVFLVSEQRQRKEKRKQRDGRHRFMHDVVIYRSQRLLNSHAADKQWNKLQMETSRVERETSCCWDVLINRCASERHRINNNNNNNPTTPHTDLLYLKHSFIIVCSSR